MRDPFLHSFVCEVRNLVNETVTTHVSQLKIILGLPESNLYLGNSSWYREDHPRLLRGSNLVIHLLIEHTLWEFLSCGRITREDNSV